MEQTIKESRRIVDDAITEIILTSKSTTIDMKHVQESLLKKNQYFSIQDLKTFAINSKLHLIAKSNKHNNTLYDVSRNTLNNLRLEPLIRWAIDTLIKNAKSSHVTLTTKIVISELNRQFKEDILRSVSPSFISQCLKNYSNTTHLYCNKRKENNHHIRYLFIKLTEVIQHDQ